MRSFRSCTDASGTGNLNQIVGHRGQSSGEILKLRTKDFGIRGGRTVDLQEHPTRIDPLCHSNEAYRDLLEAHVSGLSALQDVLYASNRFSLRLIFQAVDAAGKDGAIKHVMSGVNPQGCHVFSVKDPSAIELQHDFLWRTTRELPERERIGIFNRSYYEEVLIPRVHPEIFRTEGLPDPPRHEKTIWAERYRSIRGLERQLTANGTRIVKIVLHLSKDEQRKRFLARIDAPAKNWEFSRADMEERKFWPDYMAAYQDCLAATSTYDASWYVAPADDKQIARLIVSRIVLDTLERLDLAYPTTTDERRQQLLAIRQSLVN